MTSDNIKKSKGNRKYIIIALIASVILLLLLILIIYPPYIVRNGDDYHVVKQLSQYNSINYALELFKKDFNIYPPSDALDPNGLSYCGAMKFAEAMMGQDLKGFHPDSAFRSDGKDSNGNLLYDVDSPTYNTTSRKGPYLPLENANAYRLNDIFENTGPFDGNHFVLCSTFNRVTNLNTGRKIGMPILYYKADTSKKSHDLNNPDNPDNIYNYKDNHSLLALGVPGQPDKMHPLYEDPKIFYKMTKDYKSKKISIPNRKDSFILISAGKDSLYGTKDDIVNFDMGWKPK